MDTNRRTACRLCVAVFAGLASKLSLGQDSENDTFDKTKTTPNLLLPQVVLGLVHAPEIQEELGLSETGIRDLEQFFNGIDGDWFRSRNLPLDQQVQTVAGIESKFWKWAESKWTKSQIQRLKSIELQAQGIRSLLRPDVTDALDLNASQIATLTEHAKRTASAQIEFQRATQRGESIPEAQQALEDATKSEKSLATSLLSKPQLSKLSGLLGEKFPVAELSRIYPMAPELVETKNWINSSPLKLKELRGKVVLVHYYAFQCHNCHANFGHYQRWHETYPHDEVVVIGIQTPETADESDPNQVRAAASERNIAYPVLIDLDSKNWNTWANTMWPTVYVIDKQGYIRLWWQGELNWNGAKGDKAIEELVDKLRKET